MTNISNGQYDHLLDEDLQAGGLGDHVKLVCITFVFLALADTLVGGGGVLLERRERQD